MSNALSAAAVQAASAAATRPAGDFQHPLMMGLLAVGICVLAVWIVRRAAGPAKLSLLHTPGRPNRLHPVHVIVLLILWILVQHAATFALQRLSGLNSDQVTVLAIVAGQLLLAGLALVVAAATFSLGLRRGFGLSLRHWIFDSARGAIAFLAVFPVCIGLYALTMWLSPPKGEPLHEMLRAIKHVNIAWRALIVLSAVLLAPAAEEMFFRGLMQSMLRRYVGSPWAAVVLSSLLFAAVHGPLWHTMPALFALSIALGYNYERCGRLLPAFLIHALFNAANIAIASTPQ